MMGYRLLKSIILKLSNIFIFNLNEIMKSSTLIAALTLFSLISCDTKDLRLIENGFSNYEIVLPGSADSNEIKSAHELQRYLEKISGMHLPVISEGEATTSTRIFVGNSESSKSLNVKADEIIICIDNWP